MTRLSLAIPLIFLLIIPARANDTITLSTHLVPGSYNFKTTKAIMTEAFHRVGKDLVLKSTPGERPLYEAESGNTDGDAHRIYDLIRVKGLKNLVRVPEVQQTISDYGWSKSVTSLDGGWKALKDYSVGVHSGSINSSINAEKYAKSVSKVGNHNRLFHMLKGGRFEILITTPAAAGILETDEFKDSGIRRIEEPLSSIAIYTYLHKKHERLVNLVAEALRSMKADGTYDKVLAQIE